MVPTKLNGAGDGPITASARGRRDRRERLVAADRLAWT